jgi:hypothetical protein
MRDGHAVGNQRRSQLDNWGGVHIDILVFTDLNNSRFQKKLIMFYEYMNMDPPPPVIELHGYATVGNGRFGPVQYDPTRSQNHSQFSNKHNIFTKI